MPGLLALILFAFIKIRRVGVCKVWMLLVVTRASGCRAYNNEMLSLLAFYDVEGLGCYDQQKRTRQLGVAAAAWALAPRALGDLAVARWTLGFVWKTVKSCIFGKIVLCSENVAVHSAGPGSLSVTYKTVLPRRQRLLVHVCPSVVHACSSMGALPEAPATAQ